MHVAIVGGASTIGATVAYTLATSDPTLDITLVDKAEEPAWAHAVDATHAVFHAAGAPIGRENADSFGTVRAVGADELGDLEPDLVVVTAAASRPDDATDRDAREAELEANLSIVDEIAVELRSVDPVPVLVLTNPIDRIAYFLWQQLDWPRERFLGYSLSETARTAHKIGELRGVDPRTVSCPVMGEHGDGIVPIFSKLRIDGEPAALSDDQRATVLEYVQNVPFEIAKRRGASETSRWVTSAGVARVIRTIFADGEETETTVCLSTPVAGEYGLEDGCLSVPVTLTAQGVGEILEWELEPDELERLRAAHEAIQSDLHPP
jgi:malate dehydrogenase